MANSISSSLEFDIRLNSINQDNEVVDHNIRQKLYDPFPSKGYLPVFGNLPEYSLYNGFSVSCMDKLSKNPLPYRFKSTSSPLLFAYLLSGKRSFSFNNSSKEILTSSGQWYIGYIPEKSGSGIIIGQPRLCSVKFRMDPLALYDLLDGEVENLPPKIQTLLNKLEGEELTLTGAMTPSMKAAAFKLISMQKKFSSINLEAEVLDLISLHLEELGFLNQKGGKKSISFDVRDILINSISKPPTISEMAKSFKISPFKLKSTFVKTFGIGISEFINIQRMESARIYLESGNYNVNETAQKIGYLNTSRFISSFRFFHGVNPGDYMRKAKKIYSIN